MQLLDTMGRGNALRRCAAEEAGGGVFGGGENATVEECRFFKRRDTFVVAMDAQDGTCIQHCSPARFPPGCRKPQPRRGRVRGYDWSVRRLNRFEKETDETT